MVEKPTENKELVALDNQRQAIVKQAAGIVVKDQASLDAATEYVREEKKFRKRVADFKDDLFKPLKDHIKAMEAKWFKPMLEALDNVEVEVKGKISTYVAAEEKKRKDEEDRLNKEQEAAYAKQVKAAEKKGQDVPPPPPPVKVEGPKMDGAAARKTWTFEIVDEKLIPREYLTPDTKKIGGYVRAMKESASIPGVRCYQELGVAVGSRESTEGL